MDKRDRDKIEKIIRDRRGAHRKLSAADSAVYRAFPDMETAAYTGSALSKMHKELIAVGIPLVVDCESCLEWHIHQALEAGADQDQVLEAIEMGIEMGGGPAAVSSRFALKVPEYYSRSRDRTRCRWPTRFHPPTLWTCQRVSTAVAKSPSCRVGDEPG